MSTDPVNPQPSGSEPPAAPATPVASPPPPPPVEPKRPITETRPEILVGAAVAGGFVLAQILGRVRGR